MAKIVIRPAVPSDLVFVEQTMEGTLRDNSAFCKGIHPATLSALIGPVLATYKVLVAVLPDEPDTIHGFIVYRDSTTVAFIYVRSFWRSKIDPETGKRGGGGIARALLAHAKIARGAPGSTHYPEIACAFMVTKLDNERGKAFAALAETKGYRLRFRPYIPMEITARLQHGDAGRDAE